MTVKELIEILKEMPQDLPVWIEDTIEGNDCPHYGEVKIREAPDYDDDERKLIEVVYLNWTKGE
jgi:hypothetical protein